MFPFNTELEELRYRRQVEHLHRLGPRAIDGLLRKTADLIGGWPVITRLLAEYETRLTPKLLRAVGGDRLPRRPLRVVPPGLGTDGGEALPRTPTGDAHMTGRAIRIAKEGA
jgi:hypothetical protein